ncbi:putative ATP-dependent RNA helicase ddx46 [Mactra antiquata]
MAKEGRSYRRRSRSKSRDRKRKRSRSKERRRSRSRDRRRSRSRERKRSRSRDRKRSRSRERKRSRSRERRRKEDKRRSRSRERRKRSRSRSKDRSKSKSPSKYGEGAIRVKDEPLDKEEEQKRLEIEMQKRRERIEQWRAERNKTKELIPINIAPPSKRWSLEDEDDDDDETTDAGTKVDDDDEVDPLDAYMQSVNEEIKKPEMSSGSSDPNNSGNSNSKVTIITAVAKKKPDTSASKGELMLNNTDLMEYSSEEEEEDLDSTMMNMIKKKKELITTDHSKVYYATFRKNFYVEIPEIARMTNEEAEALRVEMEGIQVRGKGCPKPVSEWAQVGVSKKVLDCLKKNQFDKPTPIQAQAIPAIMSGRDLIGIAKTGSGKTLAFLLPMFRHILDQPELDEEDGPIGVILTPTRELAMQITSDARKFTRSLGLQAVCVYGGTGISEQIAELKRGCEIVVCTPGRMIDMLAANNGRVTNLRRCTYVVLDEADRMFDMGFEPQVNRIIDNIRPDRQTVMFSATFPRQMEALARKILNKPIEIQVGGRSVVCRDVTQNVTILEEDQKLFKLLELLGQYQEEGGVIVFVDKQEHADDLMKDLMQHSYPCMSLHGGIDQYDRGSIISDFKNGDIKLLIATSIAARGLDVKHLILVINYDCPNHYEDYVHRCGRTGRAGNKGTAFTFITPDQVRYAGDIIKALELSESPVPENLQKWWDEYKKQAEADGIKIKSSSGFHGKGFKFDETEAQLVADRKKLQKAALGLVDSDEEDPNEDIEQQIEDMFASKRRVTDVSKSSLPQVPITGGLMTGAPGKMGANNQLKLEMAKRLAAKINLSKNLGQEAQDITQQATKAIFQDGVSAPQVASKTIAEQMAEKINAKLGYTPQIEDDKDVEQDTFKRYEEELEINDFPQTARWKVTSKEALAQICEYSEAGITVRGTYFPAGKIPKEEERKLYLAIEATSELAIQKAKKEVTRLIKEELIRLQNSYQPINRARYKVV